jgi:asparagine synthase (glutamine-hydrolysing)
MGQKNAATIANMIATLNPLQRNRLLRYLRRFFLEVANPPAERNLAWYSMFNRPLKKALYSDEFSAALSQDAFNYMKDLFMTAPAATVMDRTYYTDMHAYLPECLLVKMDIASMANSLEARSPLLDHKVLEFSASLPSSWKVHGLTTKYIMRRAFDRMLPPEILRRGKMGFGIPLAAWFRNQWKDYFIDTVLSPQAVQRGYFKKSALESLLQDHLSGKCDHGYRLWTLLMLELWHREYTDRSSYRP